MDIVSHVLPSMVADPRISKIAEQVWVCIASTTQEGDKGGYPIHMIPIGQIVKRVKRCRGSVYVALRQLENFGYIERFHVGMANHYILRYGTPPKSVK